MSVRVMSEVWEHSEQEGGSLLVLLALADWANDERKCWPKAETLARKARISTRQLSRVLQQLADAGELVVPAGPRSEDRPYEIRQYVVSTPMSDRDQTQMADSVRAQVGDVVEPSVEPSQSGEQGALLPDPVEDVWQHYVVTLNRPKAQLTSKVRKWIADAIKVVGVDECKRAISGLAVSEYHVQNNYVGIEYALGAKRGQTIESRVAFMAGKAGGGTGANALPTVEELLRTVPSGGAEIVRLRMERARAFIEMSAEQKQRAQEGDERAGGIVQDGNEALRLLREAPPRVEAVIDGGRLKGWARVR